MTKNVSLDFILRALHCFDGFDGPACDELWWRTDAPDYDPLTLLVNCNDVFFWGSSDAEELTPENITALEQAIADMRALNLKDDKKHEESWSKAHILWIARQRKRRPQGAYYTYIPESYWPLFHAAGPEREVGLGNPYAPGEYGRKESK